MNHAKIHIHVEVTGHDGDVTAWDYTYWKDKEQNKPGVGEVDLVDLCRHLGYAVLAMRQSVLEASETVAVDDFIESSQLEYKPN